MNIALGALIISILLLPGAVWLRAWYTSFKKKDKELHVPFSELLVRGLVYSIFVHGLAISLVRAFGNSVDFNLMYHLITGGKIAIDNGRFTTSFLQFFLYNAFVLSAVYFIVKGIKKVLIGNNYDIEYHGFRTSNYWYLIFSARYLDANRTGGRENTDLLFVDVMVSPEIVYSGFLYDFEYSPSKDELELLIISNALKRTNIKQEDGSYKLSEASSIQGDAFLIPAKQIQNLNIYYLSVSGDFAENG
jgi:hypothetical protein